MTYSIEKTVVPLERRCLLAPMPRFTLTGLGDLPGGTFISEPAAISRDGTVVAGSSRSDRGGEAFRWTESGGMQALGDLPGGTFDSEARGMSGDGRVVVGEANNEAARWVDGGAPSSLNAGGGISFYQALTSNVDGSVIAGSGGYQSHRAAIMWTREDGARVLGDLPGGGDSSFALGISDDGSIITGQAESALGAEAFRWTSAGGMEPLGDLPGGSFYSQGTGVSGNGSVIIGYSGTSSGDEAFRWTRSGGMQGLGELPTGVYSSLPLGTNTNGSTIVGRGYTERGEEAFAWTQAEGIVNLNTLVDSSANGWLLQAAYGVSDNSRIVGVGRNPDGQREAFLLTPIDYDGDGLLDQWESQGGGIDGDGDGTIDLSLYSLGASPDHKDLFVEVDAMRGYAPVPLAIQKAVAAFANAPVDNPDGSGGIKLHVLQGETRTIPAAKWGNVDATGNWPIEFEPLKASFFGNAGDSSAVKKAKEKAFRYCVFADSFEQTRDGQLTRGTSGVARTIPGVDFLVTLGAWRNRSAWDIQAGTFVHELGHSLGLHHGGNNEDEFKPNYPSVMNYTWQVPQPGLERSWQLGYSRGTLPPLDESNLSEPAGIGGRVGRVTHAARTPTLSNENKWRLVDEAGPVDLSNVTGTDAGDDASVPPDGNPWNDVGIAVDINNAGTRTVLRDHNDWAALQYAVPAPRTAPGVAAEVGITYSEYRELVEADAYQSPPRVAARFDDENGPQAIELEFSEDIGTSLTADDLVLRNVSTGAVISSAACAIEYDIATRFASITFPGLAGGLLPDGRYRLSVKAAGVTDLSGNHLDGDGNRVGGDDLIFDFDFLAADANRDRKVDFNDLVILAQNYGQSGRTFSQGNFNYSPDGKVDFSDLVILAQHYGMTQAQLAAIVGAPILSSPATASPVKKPTKREMLV